MSSTAGPARIILPVEIELDKATAQLAGFRRTAEAEVAPAAKAIAVELTKVEGAATRMGATTTKAAGGMRQQMQGAGAAVGGVMQAINLLGVQAPPQIGGIARAFGSLLMTGINPLGIALAGATGLIALWAALTKETDKATTSIERQTQAWEGLRAEIEKTATSAAAGRSGQSVSVFENRRRLGELESLRDSIEGARADTPGLRGAPQVRQDQYLAERFSPQLRGLGIIGEGQTPDAAALQRLFAEIMDARKTIADAAALARELQPSVSSDLEYQRQRNEEVRALLSRHRAPVPGLPGSALSEAITQLGMGDASALERMQRQWRTTEEKRQQDVLDRFAGNAQSEIDARSGGFPWQTFRAPLPELGGVRTMSPQSLGSSPAAAATYTQGLDRQLQASAESSVSQGIADALSPDRNKGAFERFAISLAESIRTRIAQGLADALLGNGQNFGSGGFLGSLFGGSGEPSPGGPAPSGAQVIDAGVEITTGVPKRSMQVDSAPIVIALVADDDAATGIVARSKASGFRAGMAKLSGGGVGATVPSRRR